MARIRSQNELILSLLDFFRAAQPNLDTKAGTVVRDLFVDSIGSQLSSLYQELQRIQSLQSLRLALGSDLDKLGSNYGAIRNKGTKAGGVALLTFSSIASDIPINRADVISARNGSSFLVTTGLVVSPVYANSYKATASQYRANLDLVGITDQYAVEVLVQASATGTQGNISKYNLNSTNIAGVTNVTNVVPFSGGTGTEDDASFRSRILSVFSGANTGTALGYKNAVLEDPAALDAIVIQPGDSLMTRDGTQVATDPTTGITTIVQDGTGGKIDVYVYGLRLQEVIDSFIYTDKSNTGNPSNIINDYVIGQIAADSGKTVNKKRLDDLASSVLPNQPVNNLISVSGSTSGNNFVEKSVDSYGRITGNYELVKDTGVYSGSPWGFDKLHWISNIISNLAEDKTKGTFNGQDNLSFPDVNKINTVTQRVSVTNENSRVSKTDKTSIQLSHKPVMNVTRVFNTTTGERYVVSNQNPDSSGSIINTTGRITITGNSLPAVSDILQVDYTWLLSYDPYIDFDGKNSNVNPNIRTVLDSIDWGLSNNIRREQATLTTLGSTLVATVTHPISSVVSVNIVVNESEIVGKTNSRFSVVVTNPVSNVVSIIRTSDGTDLWNTSKANGSFSGLTIFLPTDGLSVLADSVTVTYNASDIYSNDGYQGNFNNNTITIVPTVTVTAGTVVEINYIANIYNLVLATAISQLPLLRSGNKFMTSANVTFGTQPTTHIFDSYGNIIKNLRQAPSNINLAIAGSISPGVISVVGTTMTGVFESVFPVVPESIDKLTIELSQAIKNSLGFASNVSIPSTLKICRLVSLEKVEALPNLVVLGSLYTYDIKGYGIKDNSYFKSESVIDSNITVTQVRLPRTTGNLANASDFGSYYRATFYYTIDNDIENVYFSKSGSLSTNKRFAIINNIYVSSGFSSGSSASATLAAYDMNQPVISSRYQAFYDYTAPKVNERISVRYNLNKLIGDSTLKVENVRPISADVLAKEAIKVLVDVTMNIVVTSDFTNNTTTVKQNVQDTVTSALNANSLGTIIDSSDLIVVAQGVTGVDRARVLYFNKANTAGTVLSISASKNQYIQANKVTINIETR